MRDFLLTKKRVANIGIRPEHIKIVKNGKGHVKATTDVIEYLGADTFVIVNADTLGGVRIRCESNNTLEKGLKIGLKFELSKIHFFDQEGTNINI